MSIQELRNERAELARQANKLLADQGEKKWTNESQQKFDNIAADIEAIDRKISSIEKLNNLTAENSFKDAVPALNTDDKKSVQNKAVEIYLRKAEKHWTPDEQAIVQNTMTTTTGSQGGFTVPAQISSTVIELLKDFNGIRRVADSIRTANGQPLSYPGTDGTVEIGEIVDQNSQVSGQDASFFSVPLNVFKFSSKVIVVPIELVQDTTVDLLGLLNRRIRTRIGRIQNLKFTNGAGGTEPDGLLAKAVVRRIGQTGSTTTYTYDDLVELIESMDIAYAEQGDLSWMMSQAGRKVVRKMKDGNGRPIWTPSYDKGISVEGADELMGFKLNINNDYAAPAASAKSMTFGVHKNYMIRDAMDVTFMRFDDSNYARLGQVGFMAFCRSGGNLLDINSVSAYQHSAT
ncbi:phage major capsid protein [Undibacterium curvum]|uniref:Phage major capsid protein n=1 Tax=Undibacterium curvum TaxID=2762294 RepID=A0ABR7A503_9BURK|nr:phage major capsid protein [Undibacterium curvum]MBC3931984.1 phage major capsid protein [Undibacterium curvum]